MRGRKGAFRRTKNTSQIKICLKFEGGNGLIIWERFSDQSIKNLICQVFVGFSLADLWLFTSLFEAFSCFDFRQRNLVKENVNLWQISLFFLYDEMHLKGKNFPFANSIIWVKQEQGFTIYVVYYHVSIDTLKSRHLSLWTSSRNTTEIS